MDTKLGAVPSTYKSPSQIARIITENWVEDNMFCVKCGHDKLHRLKNNSRFRDFECERCGNVCELKSTTSSIKNQILGGAYQAMVDRISSGEAPDLLVMRRSAKESLVQELIIIPRSFLSLDIIRKRKPLSSRARRAGWTGGVILLKNIPGVARVKIIVDREIRNKKEIVDEFGSVAEGIDAD